MFYFWLGREAQYEHMIQHANKLAAANRKRIEADGFTTIYPKL